MDDFKSLRYDITFYGTLGYELMGSAFDELMNDTTLSEGSRPDVDDELLEPSHNPLFPKLFFVSVAQVESLVRVAFYYTKTTADYSRL